MQTYKVTDIEFDLLSDEDLSTFQAREINEALQETYLNSEWVVDDEGLSIAKRISDANNWGVLSIDYQLVR